ncbi:hypothetical protein Vadar_001611 [Vaccinium darrowii]|uniref:Uncharacterized protein n=1 Tax=Vaccinium darrowii TaxID=229202 RepID=A0ACB7XN68_9ERIC|nr:hypothetical protein Vadar_001611 [Vaccinium darrowii]
MGTTRYSLPVDRMRGPPTSPSFDLKRCRHCFAASTRKKAQPTLGISTTNITAAATADAITNTTFFVAKPGCQLKCGSLTVPYLFGIGVGSSCSIDPEFDITC